MTVTKAFRHPHVYRNSILGLIAGVVCVASSEQCADSLGSEEIVAVARGAARGIVVVEYWLRYDKGQRPELGFETTCPDPSAVFCRTTGDLVREERPLEMAGFLVARDRVVTQDLALHDRFIESIRVSYANRSVAARITAYARDRDAVMLMLEDTLPGTRPLSFDSMVIQPYVAVSAVMRDGRWGVTAAPWLPARILMADTSLIRASPRTLVVGRTGVAAGLLMDGDMRGEDIWKRSPLAWAWVSRSQRDEAVRRMRDLAERCIVHVKLGFRSPKVKGRRELEEQRRALWRSENMSATEGHAVGVCFESGMVMVLAELTAEATSRLERIEIYDAAGTVREARFVASLRDYGAFLAKFSAPLPAPALQLSDSTPQTVLRHLVLRAQVSVAGKQRIAFYWHGRVRRLEQGYRRMLFPVCETTDRDVFLFSLSGQLLAMPLALRQKSVVGQGEETYVERTPLTPSAVVKRIIADPSAYSDTSNVPLSEEQEGRIAWLGVVLQPLDRELARIYGVAEQTGDGESGALVSYVYEGSPAARAGIEPGTILLRINPEGFPKPINVRLDNPLWEEPFPWDDLDNLPEDIIERTPPPWPPADDQFSRLLTELGFGRRFRVDFVRNGVEFSRDFTVTESPVHFGTARKYRDERLGLTVRELTFEVRHHFRKAVGDPGLIVSRVETGSRASVAGIKPYEIITHLNGRPVDNVKDFERMVARADEVRLSVERIGRSRQVRIRLTAGKEAAQ